LAMPMTKVPDTEGTSEEASSDSSTLPPSSKKIHHHKTIQVEVNQ
jgi:hypothetical protein